MTTKIRLLHDTVGIPTGAVAVTQSASDNTTKVATTAYVTTALAALADSAPSTLNTLNELAAALGDDANFSTTVTNSIATKAPLASPTLTGSPKINVGTNKNISFSGSIGEIGSVPGFQATNDAGSANTDFGIRATTIRLATGSAERMRIDSSGNLILKGGQELRLNRGDNNTYGSIKYLTGSGGLQLNDQNSDGITFIRAGSSESMRINSSGEVFIGKNASSNTTKGFTVDQDGLIQTTKTGSGGQCVFLNRQDSDGIHILFRKGNSTVGSISTTGGDLTIDSGSEHTGLRFEASDITPRHNGAAANNYVDLGTSSSKFKDLHLSGIANTASVNVNGGTGNSYVSIGSDTGNWVWKNYRANHKLALEDSDGTGEVLNFNTNGNATFTGNVNVPSHDVFIGGATGAWIDSNDVLVTNGRGAFRGFGHSPLALGRYNSGATAGEDGTLIDFLYGGAGVGSIAIAEGPAGSRGLKLTATHGLELKTQEQHTYHTVTLNGAVGSTVGLGQFANNGRGWWIRVTANTHYSSQVSSQVWEFTQNAYVGQNHNTWLQIPETISSSYHAGENHIALDVYRDNVAGSTSTPTQIRFRSKGKTGSNGGVYYTIESLNSMTYSVDGRGISGTTSGTWANTSSANMNGAVGGYYPTRSKYEFPVSAGAFWTNNAVINADGAKGLYISNKGTVGIGFDKHMHTTSNVAMAGGFDHAGTLHLAGNDAQIVQTSTYGSNSEFMHYVFNDYYKIFRNTAGVNQQALHIASNLVVSGDLNDTSDRNLKKNIVDLPDGSLAIVSQLKPVTFDWKNTDKGSNTGFIAQDVKTVLPNDVSGTEYKESSDLHETNDGLSINSTGIVAHLVKAIQELEKRVKELEG